MSIQKSTRLGKGLSAIFADEDPTAPEASGQPRALAVTQIYPSATQPRRHFDKAALDELADSIKEKGILQPLLVRPHPSKPNAYEIVAGERRWRAAQVARLHEVPVVVRDIKDKEALEFGIIENIQRAELTPIEEAQSFERLIAEFSHTQDDLAHTLGKSRSYISNMLRLNQLPDTVKELIKQGSLSAGHARALLGAKNPLVLANEVIKGGLSVRQTENLVKLGEPGEESRSGDTSRQRVAARVARKGSASARAKQAIGTSADVLKLERDISSWLGLKVKLNQKSSGAGNLVISYATLDQLEDVLKRLSQTPAEE